jgi:hypothetical protein
MLQRLESGETEVSHRNRIPLQLQSVEFLSLQMRVPVCQ